MRPRPQNLQESSVSTAAVSFYIPHQYLFSEVGFFVVWFGSVLFLGVGGERVVAFLMGVKWYLTVMLFAFPTDE